MFKCLALLVLSSALLACQNPRLALEELAASNRYTVSNHILADLPLLQLRSLNLNSKQTRIRVYIEGDGRAWITQSQPSLDPTPHNLLMPQLAVADLQPSVYLGRPCQFLRNEKCLVPLWTSARFGAAVLATMHLALDQLRAEFKNTEFELVGYSGGAAIALLLAAQRDDVKQVQTIAGNLSPMLWAKLHNLTPLNNSKDPLTYAQSLQHVPQRHFVGTLDTNISIELFRLYIQQLAPLPACIERIDVAHADHASGWHGTWQVNANRPIRCMSKSELMR